MNIKFIRAELRHVDDYIRIGASVISRLYLTVSDPDEVATEIAQGITYMISVDDEVIGYITYFKREDGSAELDEFAVERDHQRKGIGTLALDFILNELRTYPRIELVTHPENPAKKLYERFGFCETGKRIENYWESGEPRVEMALIHSS